MNSAEGQQQPATLRPRKPRNPESDIPPEAYRWRLLDVEATAKFICRSVWDVRDMHRKGVMPAPVMLGRRKLAWRIGDLIDWTEAAKKKAA